MKVKNFYTTTDELTSQPKLVITLELDNEPLQDHYSTFHKRDHYAQIGEQLVEALKAAKAQKDAP